jgi:hypothetical protein
MRLEMCDSFPLGGARHPFFPKRSFSAALSSMASASKRLSHVFSSAACVTHGQPGLFRLNEKCFRACMQGARFHEFVSLTGVHGSRIIRT